MRPLLQVGCALLCSWVCSSNARIISKFGEEMGGHIGWSQQSFRNPNRKTVVPVQIDFLGHLYRVKPSKSRLDFVVIQLEVTQRGYVREA